MLGVPGTLVWKLKVNTTFAGSFGTRSFCQEPQIVMFVIGPGEVHWKSSASRYTGAGLFDVAFTSMPSVTEIGRLFPLSRVQLESRSPRH